MTYQPSYSPDNPNGSYNAPPNSSNSRATVSLVLGITSLLAGWIFIAPIIGLAFGISSKKHEPMARTMANWGIGLNIVCLLVWVLLLIFMVGITGFAFLGYQS